MDPIVIYTCGKLCESEWLADRLYIALQRGLRQGCALAMPLYVLTAEILATHIRAHPNIRGLQHPASQPSISQYAYDTTLLLADDDSITNALKVFKVYEEASGAKLNLQKCKGLWCDAYRHRTDAPTDFDWTNTHLPHKLLGIYVGNTDCTDKNVEYKIHKLGNILATSRFKSFGYKWSSYIYPMVSRSQPSLSNLGDKRNQRHHLQFSMGWETATD